MKHALLIADDRPERGRGHAVRSEALADALNAAGWYCVRMGYWPAPPPVKADLVVVDGYDFGQEFLDGLPGIKVVIADTPLPNLRADLIVCGGAGARESWFEASRSLSGPRYAILRPEFSAAAKRRAQGLADDSGVIDFRHLDGHMLAADIAALMCSAEVGISYAGMRAMELACVGVPSVLVVQADNQEFNALALTGAGAAVMSSSDEMAESLAVDLMGMPEIRGAMSRAASKVTDGLGCSRVVEYLNRKMRGVA